VCVDHQNLRIASRLRAEKKKGIVLNIPYMYIL